MRKIISLFQRNYDGDRLVRDEVVPGAEWVLAGEGIATRKWDGTCCMIRAGQLLKRYELKAGKTAPPNFEAAQAPDSLTGKQPGWLPVGDGPEDQWLRAAFQHSFGIGWTRWSKIMPPGTPMTIADCTYEAVGPHFGGGHHDKNPEGLEADILVRHGAYKLEGFPRDFEAVKRYFETMEPAIEGVVWHHPDRRMVKIKARDFGIRRPITQPAESVCPAPAA